MKIAFNGQYFTERDKSAAGRIVSATSQLEIQQQRHVCGQVYAISIEYNKTFVRA